MSAQVNVIGLRTTTGTNYDVSYNDEMVEFKLHDQSSIAVTTSWKTYGQITGAITTPDVNVQFMEQYGAVILRINSEGILQYRSITGSSLTANSLVAYATWFRKT